MVHLASMARDGDLTIIREDFNVRSEDEIGIMADAFSAMIANQRESVKAIASRVAAAAGSVDVIRTQMTEVSTSAERVAIGSENLRKQVGTFRLVRDPGHALSSRK